MSGEKIVCDSSSIIALSVNCLLWLLEKFDAEFIIPPKVQDEIFYTPANSRLFSFEALRNGTYIGKVLKVVRANRETTLKILEVANSLIAIDGHYKRILHRGEAEALALIIDKNIKNFLVDERTARLIVENPRAIADLMERRMHKRVGVNEESLKRLRKWFSGVRVIRSAEVVAVAIKRGILNWPYPKRKLLYSALFAIKKAGCAISEKEILEIVKLYSK